MRTIKGKQAKDKGSRGERLWRDELRRIYDTAQEREKIKRVPMSGASWMKGDVVDLNDYDTLYEVKNCEKLEIPAWWRQAVRESGSSRTPVLAVTQNNRPFFVFMTTEDVEALYKQAGVSEHLRKTLWKRQKGLLDAISRLGQLEVIEVLLGSKDQIVLTGMQAENYIYLKKLIREMI